MSYDDYINHIVQKYRLALSIAVIGTKPENTTLEEHIQQLKNKINEEFKNSDDLSISLCSDDFRIDETYHDKNNDNIDSNNDDIDKNNDEIARFKDETDNNNQKFLVNSAEITDRPVLVDIATNVEQNNDKSERWETNDEIYHQNKANEVEINTQDLNDSGMILQHNKDGNVNLNDCNIELYHGSSFEDLMKILKTTDDVNKEKEIPIKISTHNNINEDSERMDITEYGDSDTTFCLDISSNVEKYSLSQKRSCNFNVIRSSDHKDSQTENDMQVTDTCVNPLVNCKEMNNKLNQYNTNKTELYSAKSELINQPNYDIKQNVNLEDKLEMTECKPQCNIREYRHKKEFKNIYQNVAHIFDNTGNNRHKDAKVNKSNKNNNVTSNKFKEIPNKLQDIPILPDNLTCNTHFSESQVNDLIIIEDKYIHGIGINNKQQKKQEIHDDITNETQLKYFSINKGQANTTINKEQDSKINEKYTKRKAEDDIFTKKSQITNVLTKSTHSCEKSDDNNDKEKNMDFKNQSNNDFPKRAKSRVKYIENDLFSQESQLTYFSTVSTYNSLNNLTENSLAFTQDSQSVEDQVGIKKPQDSVTYDAKVKDMTANKNWTAFDKVNNVQHDQIESNTDFDKDLENIQVTNEVRTENDKNSEVKQVKDQQSCTNFDNSAEFDEKVKKMPVTEYCTNFDDNLENMEWTDSQTEFIPFKIIEELNKIKTYLNKKNEKKLSVEGFSSDTGYKSDSQSKNSFKLSQSATGWLDQSAHTIFNYIIECPLVVTTQSITNEISVVLGQLIDKLYEEERYPVFLEELLDTVQLLIGVVYSEKTAENVLMKKDETIQRILLLNKSIHIQKYTIEKITYILDSLHTDLTSNNALQEIKNIDQIENTCYIFHILEIILQKYNKTSQNLSQNTQSSQEEKILKKSNIMDLWRKKWNPNYKESQNEGSSEKKCILSNCSAVLNRLIVGCMDGYSLVSYFALKCFNVMQT